MGVNKFNSEGYYDPTPYEALTNILREERKDRSYRPLVYVCSPYAGKVEENLANARKYSRFAVDRGYIPVTPHLLLPQFMSEENERDLIMFMDIVLLSKCAELWVFGKEISPGMSVEIDRANRKAQPIRYFTEDLKEVTR